MKLKTRVFELCNGKYANLTELAQTMGISAAQVYRVRQGKRGINETFIVGTVKAFPEYKLDDLFYVIPNMSRSEKARQIVNGSRAQQKPDLPSKVMLTSSEVARLLRLHPNTVRRWSNQGILESHRISSRGDRRFRQEDVDGLLKKERETE